MASEFFGWVVVGVGAVINSDAPSSLNRCYSTRVFFWQELLVFNKLHFPINNWANVLQFASLALIHISIEQIAWAAC